MFFTDIIISVEKITFKNVVTQENAPNFGIYIYI